jgi:hypothetical protein
MGTQVRVIMRLQLPYNRSCTITSTIDNAMGASNHILHNAKFALWNVFFADQEKLINSELLPLRAHLQCVTKAT